MEWGQITVVATAVLSLIGYTWRMRTKSPDYLTTGVPYAETTTIDSDVTGLV